MGDRSSGFGIFEVVAGKSPNNELGIGVFIITASRIRRTRLFIWPENPLLVLTTRKESGATTTANDDIMRLIRVLDKVDEPAFTSVSRKHTKAAQIKYTYTRVYSPDI